MVLTTMTASMNVESTLKFSLQRISILDRGVQTALRQSEPQVDQRLTTSLQLRPVHPRFDLVYEEETSAAWFTLFAFYAAHSERGVFNRALIR